MISGCPIRNRFCAAALGGLLLVTLGTAAGCSDDGNSYAARQQEQEVGIQLLKQRYPGSRLHAIIEEQRTNMDGEDTIKFLVANNIDLELSADGLPDGAAIRLFKDRWQINPFLTAARQGWAVHMAVDYAQGQARDGLPYGVGESFSVIGTVLSPVGSVKTTKPDTPLTGSGAPQP